MAVITAALVTQPVFGQVAPHQLVITENSSTSLSATYDGSTTAVTVTFNGPDNWLIDIDHAISFDGAVSWVEPENPALGNALFSPTGNNQLMVFSDATSDVTMNFTPASDESTVNNFGFDFGDQRSISVTFDDDGDIAAAPDTGTTGSLLGLSLMGLAFLRRKLC